MRGLLTYPATPRGKWVVLVAFLVAMAAIRGAELPSKFADAEKNETRSFLPGDAESTAAMAIREELTARNETATTIIAYHRDGGLKDEDRQAIARNLPDLNFATREFPLSTSFWHPAGAYGNEPYQVSEDGSTALIGNVIRSGGRGDPESLTGPVGRYREIVREDAPEGLEVKVTGPAGISADAIDVFGGINRTLLLGAFGLVIALLIAIYRSPVFWFFPIIAVSLAEVFARAFGYILSELGVTVNGQSASILSILVIGAGTNYALLLVARYREELHRHQDKHEAMAIAVRRAAPTIVGAGLTVMAALLCLTVAKVDATAGLGPIGAMGIAVSVLVTLTFLPALLTIVGRRPFWPFIPYGPEGRDAPDHTPFRVPVFSPLADRLGPGVAAFAVAGGLVALMVLAAAPVAGIVLALLVAGITAGLRRWYPEVRRDRLDPFEERMHAREQVVDETHGFWRRVGERVAARPGRVGGAAVAALVVMALGLLNFSTGLTQSTMFRDSVESIEGFEMIRASFPLGQFAPTDIVLPPEQKSAAPRVVEAMRRVDGVEEVPDRPGLDGDAGLQFSAFLDVDPYSGASREVIPRLRRAVQGVAPGALIGGPTAIEHDLREAAADDMRLIIPLALVTVLLVLAVQLRALVAPVLLVATVVLSYLAALGVGAIVFDVIFDFPGAEPSLPLYAFIFLIALGVDYNIFLMARVREETMRHGTREGMLRGLAVTGGVITSAGIVLAGTFAILGVLPLTFLTELGFVIAFGVLLDTFVVRSILVPALVFRVGPRIWWPQTVRGLAGSGPAPTASPAPGSPPTPGA